MGAEVGFACDVGDGEADPEGGAEELLWREVSEALGGEEDSHDRASGGDAEEDGDGAHHPGAMEGEVAVLKEPRGAGEGEEKEAVVEDGCGGLVDASDGVGGEEECCDADDCPEKEEGVGDAAMGCDVGAEFA